MKRSLFISCFLHVFVLTFTWLGLPDWMKPEPDVKVLKVQLVTAKNVKQAEEKKVEKTNTQQSAAPARPEEKKKPEVQRKPKHETKVVSQKSKKKTQVQEEKKKEPPQQQKEAKEKPISRPEKLDKTKNKKNVIKHEDAEKKVAKKEDDFLKTLDFIKDLKQQETAQVAHKQADEDTTPTTLTSEDYASIAVIKKHIEKNWFRPPGIKDLDQMSVQIEVAVNRDGTIDDLQLVKSSGQRFFDNSLLRAVRKSVPLPVPGDRYDVFKVIELHFNG